MTDVNEEIVAKYYEMNGYLVHRNLPYPVSKKFSPDSDIDLLIYNSNTNDKAIIEVKGWHTETFTLKSYFKNVKRLYNFVRPESLSRAEMFFGDDDFRKIIVVPKLPKKEEKVKEIKEFLKTKNIDEVLDFEPILKYIYNNVNINKNYRDSEVLQTVRLLKKYLK